MELDQHIADFYQDAARILVSLYQSFPRKVLLFTEDICGAIPTDEYGLPGRRHVQCYSTALWLADSGYLQYFETIKQEALDQAVLSHKGFTLLSSSPSADIAALLAPASPPVNYAELLRLLVKKREAALLANAMQQLMHAAPRFQ